MRKGPLRSGRPLGSEPLFEVRATLRGTVLMRDLEVRVVQSEGKRDVEVGLPIKVGAEKNPRGRGRLGERERDPFRGRGKKSKASGGWVLSCGRKTSRS